MRNFRSLSGIACLCFLAACVNTHPNGGTVASDTDEYPPRFFSSKESAVASAEKAFAGGSFQELDMAKKKVLVLYHYASGAFSSDAAIYLEGKGQWRLIAYHAPILNDSIEATADGSFVILKSYQKKQVLLTVSVTPEPKRPNQGAGDNRREPLQFYDPGS